MKRKPITKDNFPKDKIVYAKDFGHAIVLPMDEPFTDEALEYREKQGLWFLPTKKDKTLLAKALKEAEEFYSRPTCQG